MFDTSTKRALLGLVLSLLVNQVQDQADKLLQIFPNVINGIDEIKEGSTLNLACIEKLAGDNFYNRMENSTIHHSQGSNNNQIKSILQFPLQLLLINSKVFALVV